jgi:hypothetical protein
MYAVRHVAFIYGNTVFSKSECAIAVFVNKAKVTSN